MAVLIYGVSTDGDGSWAIAYNRLSGVWDEVEHLGKFYTVTEREELAEALEADDDENGREWDAGRLQAFLDAEERLEKEAWRGRN
jgi:hypothetical protein